MPTLIPTMPGDGLSFGAPEWFWGLLLLLPLLWFFADAGRRREQLLSRILAPRLRGQLAGRLSPLKRNLRAACLLGALALTLTALAKPRLGYREQEVRTKGRDVILAIDTSRSMLSTDTAPSRLGRAKLIAQDLLELLKGDRVGLIAFAGNSFLQAPLTLDKGAVLNSINDLDTNTIPRGGTDIAAAIRMAMEAFGKGEGMTRALVLMTDGEDLEASGLEAAKEAAAAGIRIFTIGFGSPAGSLIPIRTESGRNDFVRDETGRPVTSRLDAARLGEIAKITGGFYQPYGHDAAKAIFDKGVLPMEAQETGVLSGRKPIERYAWPATAALLLLFLRSLLGEGRGTRASRPSVAGLSAVMMGCMVFWAPGDLRASGISDYHQGNYQGALQDFEKRLQAGASAAEVRFDAGAAAYKAGDFKKAAGYFSEAMTSAKEKIRQAATYNLANALVRTGEMAKENDAKLSDWKNALQHYETVLKSDPRNAAAKENRDIVRKLIEDLKKKQDQQKKNDKDQKKDNKDKDQQKSDQSQGGGGGQKENKDQKDDKENKDQSKSDQSQGGGNGQKEDKGQQEKDQQNKEGQQKDQKPDQAGQDQKSGEKGDGQPSPTPSPSPDQGKGQGEQQKQGQQGDRQNQDQKPGSPQERNAGQQQGQGGRPTPTPAPSATPRKEGALGGGEKGGKEQGEAAAPAEAEEGKDGGMSANQARALLRSVQDEEQHVISGQHRAVEQTLRDW